MPDYPYNTKAIDTEIEKSKYVWHTYVACCIGYYGCEEPCKKRDTKNINHIDCFMIIIG
jgi:hypothetical protein